MVFANDPAPSPCPPPSKGTVIDLAFKADGKGNAAPPTNGLESDAYSGHAAPYDETSVMYITFRKG